MIFQLLQEFVHHLGGIFTVGRRTILSSDSGPVDFYDGKIKGDDNGRRGVATKLTEAIAGGGVRVSVLLWKPDLYLCTTTPRAEALFIEPPLGRKAWDMLRAKPSTAAAPAAPVAAGRDHFKATDDNLGNAVDRIVGPLTPVKVDEEDEGTGGAADLFDMINDRRCAEDEEKINVIWEISYILLENGEVEIAKFPLIICDYILF